MSLHLDPKRGHFTLDLSGGGTLAGCDTGPHLTLATHGTAGIYAGSLTRTDALRLAEALRWWATRPAAARIGEDEAAETVVDLLGAPS